MHKNVTYPLLLLTALVVMTIVISLFGFDADLQRLFYRDHQWYLAKSQPWRWLYEYGTYPAILVGLLSFFILIGGQSLKKFIPGRRSALLMLLTLIIGPGLIINGVLKDRWGRPRPREVQQFDGRWEFREIWEPGIPGKGKSFPCGHCSTGFYFIVLYYTFRNGHRRMAQASVALSIAYGSLMGFTRIVQGGHFLSDVMWSGGIIFLTAHALNRMLERRWTLPAFFRIHGRKTKTALSIAGLAIFAWIFLFSQPFFKEYRHTLPANLQFNALELTVNDQVGNITIVPSTKYFPLSIETEISGFGYPRKKFKSDFMYSLRDDTLQVGYMLEAKGMFYEIGSTTSIEINSNYPLSIKAHAARGDISFDRRQSPSLECISLELSAPRGMVEKIEP